jgi:hypothetical protein
MPTAVVRSDPTDPPAVVAAAFDAATAYDAEFHIGLVAGDATSAVARANTLKLNAALDAQNPEGKFTFRDGRVGPVLKPICCGAKEFYFAGTIQTGARIGGVLCGAGGRSYLISSLAYGQTRGVGGFVTRFTRIDGDQDWGRDEREIVRVRGAGWVISGIEFRGRRYDLDPTGEGPDGPQSLPPKQPKTPIGISIEAKAGSPTMTLSTIRDCTIAECDVGINTVPYFHDANGNRVMTHEHADLGTVEDCNFWGVSSVFRQECNQSVNWHFRSLHVSAFGGAGYTPVTVFDLVTGGDVYCWGLRLDHYAATVVKLKTFAASNLNIDVQGMRWDRGTPNKEQSPTQPYYLTLFHYDHPKEHDGQDLSWKRARVRIEGSISDTLTKPHNFHTNRLLIIPDLGCPVGIPLAGLRFDVAGIPKTNFASKNGYLTPTPAWRTKLP